MAQWVRSLDLTAHTSLSPIRRGFAPSFVNYKKGCTRLAVASDKVYQLLAQGRWFSPGTPASSTTKTNRHDIAGILLKVALSTKIQIQILIIFLLHFRTIATVCYFLLLQMILLLLPIFVLLHFGTISTVCVFFSILLSHHLKLLSGINKVYLNLINFR